MIPKKVPIAGHWVKITWADMDGKWGDYDNDKLEIRLCKTIKDCPEIAIPTLCHEMFHASLQLSGLNEILGREAEEAVVRNFEQILLPAIQSLVDN